MLHLSSPLENSPPKESSICASTSAPWCPSDPRAGAALIGLAGLVLQSLAGFPVSPCLSVSTGDTDLRTVCFRDTQQTLRPPL